MKSQTPAGFRVGAFLQLAVPMIVSRAGLAVMGIADGVMVARYKPVEFAWLSLAEGTLGRVLDICVAFLIGGLLLAPRLFAQGNAQAARRVWLRTLPAALCLGIIGVVAGAYGRSLLLLIGQRADLATGAGQVMFILSIGYPAALVGIAAAVYLEGIQRARIVAVCVVVANVINLALNWIFIGGHFGAVAMGAKGSALSTTVMRWILGITLASVAWRTRVQETAATEAEPDAKTQWKLSFGSAASMAAMVALSSCLILFAGRLGVLSLAIFSAAWALAGPASLMTLGMADATGVFVAAEAGRAGRRAAATTAWSCLLLILGMTVAVALILCLAPQIFAGFYAKDPAMKLSIGMLLPLVAIILVLDGIGFTMASSLRAIREAFWPAAIEVSAMLLLVPIAAALALWRGYGVQGLFIAMMAAGAVRSSGLLFRFFWRVRTDDSGKAELNLEPNLDADHSSNPLELTCR
jgi:MATE family multidrug resistance protein